MSKAIVYACQPDDRLTLADPRLGTVEAILKLGRGFRPFGHGIEVDRAILDENGFVSPAAVLACVTKATPSSDS